MNTFKLLQDTIELETKKKLQKQEELKKQENERKIAISKMDQRKITCANVLC